MNPRVIRPLAAVLIFAALGTQLLWPALVGDQVLSSSGFWTRRGPFPKELRQRTPPEVAVMSDAALQFVPWLRYAADGLQRDGHIPLWKDTASCGAPFVGNGQSAVFFPTVLPAILLGAPSWIFAAQALAKLVGGAFCAWLLARHLGLSFLAALACGLAFGFGGFQVVWLPAPLSNVSLLLPLLLLVADRVVLEPKLRNVGLLALVAGLQHLGGHPETAFHSQSLALACVVVRAISLRDLRERWSVLRRIGTALAGLSLGAAIGAIQILPLLEYLAWSDALQERRHANYHFAVVGNPLWSSVFVAALVAAAFAFKRLATAGGRWWRPGLALFAAAFVALLAGMHAGLSHECLQVLAADWFGDIRNYHGTFNYIDGNGAFAGAALPLAVLGLLHGRPRGVAKFLGVLLAAGLLVGFRAPVVSDLVQVLPVFDIAANQRLQFVALLATALLAGFGLDAIGRIGREACSRRRFALAFSVPALAAIAAMAAGVQTGLLPDRNVPPRPDGAPTVDALLLSAENGAVFTPRLPELLPCEERPLTSEEGRVFTGLFWPARPLSGARLIYGRESDSTIARTVLLTADAPADGARVQDPAMRTYFFRAVAPREAFLPQAARVRLWVAYQDGTTALSELCVAPDDAAPRWCPFPAQPADGPAAGQLSRLALSALLVIVLLPARGWHRRVARIGLVVLIGADMHAFIGDKLPMLPPELFYPSSAPLLALQKLQPAARMLNLRDGVLRAELPACYGIPDVQGYDALCPRHIATLLHAACDAPGSEFGANKAEQVDLVLLGLMSVKALCGLRGPPGAVKSVRYDLDADPCSRPFVIAINPEFLPRARLTGGAVVEPDDARALALLRDPAFPRDRSVVLASGSSRAASEAQIGNAKIIRNRPDEVSVAIAPTAPGWLVLSDTFFPGWRALVDGEQREIVRANIAFRAVEVRPGDRVVAFLYEPFWYRCGAVVSLAAGALALLACLFRQRAGSIATPG